jgi:hypothetical protein
VVLHGKFAESRGGPSNNLAVTGEQAMCDPGVPQAANAILQSEARSAAIFGICN